jgi:hypothetical protein
VSLSIRPVEYFYANVENDPLKSYEMLAQMASAEISLLAFSAVPYGPNYLEFTIFPEDSAQFQRVSAKAGWILTGPQHAILVQSDDRLGALAAIHKRLHDAGVAIYASSGVTDGEGRYGYVIYTREGDHIAAEKALSE